MSFIYRATNKENGKKYIGRTSYNKLHKRISMHMWYARHKNSNIPFSNALRKYGRDGFIWDILEECDRSIDGDREVYWIEKEKPEYNVTLGGDGGTSGIPCPEHVKEATRKSRIIAVRDKRTGIEYPSMKAAREATGCREGSISRALRNPTHRWERVYTK